MSFRGRGERDAARAPYAPPALPEDAHKGDAGRVLCLCGSAEMPGAALLSVAAALRAGAGLVTLGCLDDELALLLPTRAPEALLWIPSGDDPVRALEARLAERRDDARLAGPGLGATARTRAVVERLIAAGDRESVLVLDADALNVVGTELGLLRGFPGDLVVTPHPGEAARLLGRRIPGDESGRAEAARALARAADAVCCLKGAGTVVTDGERTHVNRTGNRGMATGGAGDVLSGMLVAYLARASETFGAYEATCLAVHTHGLAGDLAAEELGVRGLIAGDLVEWLPAAQRTWEA